MIRVDFDNDGFSIDCEVNVDGNMYCVLGVGWSFATMPAGFGSTVIQAVSDFKSKVRNERPPHNQKPR